jgi:hypothetical protein
MKTLILVMALLMPIPIFAQDSTQGKVLHIYQDADLSRHSESSKAIPDKK